jgi:hypothetical protein
MANAADSVRLDWSHAPVREPALCVQCDRPALLRHPITGSPCHKVCADAQADRAAASTRRTLT